MKLCTLAEATNLDPTKSTTDQPSAANILFRKLVETRKIVEAKHKKREDEIGKNVGFTR